jgi:hypothetical protein
MSFGRASTRASGRCSATSSGGDLREGEVGLVAVDVVGDGGAGQPAGAGEDQLEAVVVREEVQELAAGVAAGSDESDGGR